MNQAADASGTVDCFIIAQSFFNQAVDHAHAEQFHRGFIIGEKMVPAGVRRKNGRNLLQQCFQFSFRQHLQVFGEKPGGFCRVGSKQHHVGAVRNLHRADIRKNRGNRVTQILVDAAFGIGMHVEIDRQNAAFFQVAPDQGEKLSG